MEITLDDKSGLPDDCIISIRSGATRRQAPLETVRTHPLKFPTPQEACCEPLKIDVLQPVASARLVLHPNEARYRIGLDSQDGPGQGLMAIGLKIGAGKDGIKNAAADGQADRGEGQSPQPKNYQDAAASARDYLETHGLLRYVQALLHAVIQVKPKDPYLYIMQQLSAPRAEGSNRPKTPGPDAEAYRNGGVINDFLGQAFLPPGAAPEPPKTPPTKAPPAPESPAPAVRPAHPPKMIGRSKTLPANVAENFRLRMRDMLEMACDTGELHRVMETVLKDPQNVNAAKGGRELEDARQKVRSLFEATAMNGRLEDVLSRQMGKAETLEDLRMKMRRTMEHAADSGLLQDALGQAKSQDAKSQEINGIRSHMRNLLASACDSGDLQSALSKAMGGSALGEPKARSEGFTKQTERRLARDGNPYTYSQFVEFFGQEWGPCYWQSAPPDPSVSSVSGEVEAVRQKMRALMEAACDSGALREAFVEISPKARKRASLHDSDSMLAQASLNSTQHPRPKERTSIFDSPKNAGFFEPSTAQVVTEAPNGEVERMRNQMRNLLETACDSGALHQAMDEARLKKQDTSAPSDVDSMRAQMRNLLESACDSGKLETALQKALPKKDAATDKGDDLEDLRTQMRHMLSSACDTGELQGILGRVPNQDPRVAGTESIRLQMRELLETSCDNGKLQDAFNKAKEATNDSDAEGMARRMRSLLETAVDNGSLQAALSKVQKAPGQNDAKAKQASLAATPGDAEVETTRVMMRTLLENACDSGALETAMEKIKEQETSAVEKDSQAELNIDQMKAKMRETLEQSCASGQLHAVIREISTEKEASAEDKSIHDCKLRLRQLFESAYESGNLGNALLSAFQQKNDSQADPTVNELKVRMRDMLATSCESGKLGDALNSIRPNKADIERFEAAAEKTQLQDLKLQMRELLEKSAVSGDLNKALKTLEGVEDDEIPMSAMRSALPQNFCRISPDEAEAEEAKKPDDEVEETAAEAASRARVRQSIANATKDNSLQEALDRITKNREAKAKAAAEAKAKEDASLPGGSQDTTAAAAPAPLPAPPKPPAEETPVPPAAASKAVPAQLQAVPPSTAKPGGQQRPKSACAVFHQAQSTQPRTVYLPKAVRDPTKGMVAVLVEEKGNMWRATNDLLKAEAGGIGYRNSKDLTDLMGGAGMSLKWGASLHGFDDGDGWVRFQLASQAEPNSKTSGESPIQTLNQDITHMKEDNQNLQSVVASLAKQMEDLKKENQNLVEKLSNKPAR